MTRRSSSVLYWLLVGVASAGIAAAQVPADRRVLVTDPARLQKMGFSPDAKNVYELVRQEERSDVGGAQHDFGVSDPHFVAISAKSFTGRTDPTGTDWAYDGGIVCCVDLNRLGNEVFADAQFILPDGALFDGLRWWAYDADAANDMNFFFFEVCQPDFSAGASTITSLTSDNTTGSTGYQSSFDSVGITVNNKGCIYLARVSFGGTGNTNSLQKIRIQWFRQISPAPATATFGDVPTSHPFFRVIEALAASQITTGCGGGNFCPNGTVTRQEVAKFLARALGLYFP